MAKVWLIAAAASVVTGKAGAVKVLIGAGEVAVQAVETWRRKW